MRTFQRALCLLAVGVLISLPAAALAQDSGPPQPPSGPMLKSAPQYAEWIVNFTYPKPNMDTPPPPSPADQFRTKTITTTKTATIIHELIVDGAGQSMDRWYIGGAQYFRTPGAKTWLESHAGDIGNGANFAGLPANGFRGLDWIVTSNYVGTIAHVGRQCLVFTQVASISDKHKLPSPDYYQQWDTYALVDLETRLPVEVKQLGAIRAYRFTDLPNEKQELPPDLAKVIADGQSMRARISQPPPRPY